MHPPPKRVRGEVQTQAPASRKFPTHPKQYTNPKPTNPEEKPSNPPGGWLGSGAEEGRAKRRYASGRRMEPLIRGSPNGAFRRSRKGFGTQGGPQPSLRGNPPNGNILVGGGRENNSDPLSRGDRKGESPNQIPWGKPTGDVVLQGSAAPPPSKPKWAGMPRRRG